jgi:ABC-type antimicrobial peptide transport system permease subunit
VRAAFALRCSTRSLAREGPPTLLAVFCIAVGVMAVVSLRLAGLTLADAELHGLRQANGGDVALAAGAGPLSAADLAHLDDLRRQGLVSDWTATQDQLVRASDGPRHAGAVELRAVDPAHFPLVGDGPTVVEPAGRNLRSLLARPGAAVLSTSVRDLLAARPGDRVQAATGSATLTLAVGGVVADPSGSLGAVVLIGRATLAAAEGGRATLYQSAAMTTPGAAQAATAARDLRRRFPLATVRTTADLLGERRDVGRRLTLFLQLVGLLALLVGGTGIAHTLQVTLARRRVEIAMLKTAGCTRRELLALFGLEAAWLGLAGGVAGAGLGAGAGAALAALAGALLGVGVAPALDPAAVAGGVAVGLATSLTFGILPIVRASGVRPLAVLRDGAGEGWRSRLLTAPLLAVLAVLFCLLAFAILGDAGAAVLAVGGGLAGLSILGLGFALAALLTGRLRAPERAGRRSALAVPLLLAVAAVAFRTLPQLAVLLAGAAAAGTAAAVAPRRARASLRLALRGVGRRPLRSGTTLLALFVGVLACAALGQALSGELDAAANGSATWNVYVFSAPGREGAVRAAAGRLAGVRRSEEVLAMTAAPAAVDGVPASEYLDGVRARSGGSLGGAGLFAITSLQGVDLAHGQRPDAVLASDPGHPARPAGRLLTAADAGTTSALGGEELLYPPWNLRPGATIRLVEARSGAVRTITLVGFYRRMASVNDVRALQVDRGLVASWAGPGASVNTYLSVDPTRKAADVAALGAADPTAVVFDLGFYTAAVAGVLRNVVVFVLAIASLAVLAGAVIVANTVALAAIERRREIGIMKAVGFQRRDILLQALLESAVLGCGAGAAAILLVSAAIGLGSRAALGVPIDASVPLGTALVVASGALAALVAGGVAWGPSRARPLEVLRRE